MSIVKNKAGVKTTPAFITSYLIFISLDLFTTWLASPNLYLEGNKLVRSFDLSWPVIIIGTYTFGISISILFAYASNNLLKDCFNSSIRKIALKDLIFTKKYVIPFLIFTIFFSHLFISIFLTINNIFSYIYIQNIENHLTPLSIKYLKFKSLFNPNFYFYSYTLFCCFAIIISYIKVKNTITRQTCN